MVYRTEMDGNNKVAVPYANYIKENAPTFTFDTVVDMNTAIQNGDVPAGAVIYCKQETPGGVSGDSALDPNSTNWVQNSAITAAMNGKASTSALQTVSDNLGSPSSASSVTGDDAFSKINTLNSDLVEQTGTVAAVVGSVANAFVRKRNHIVDFRLTLSGVTITSGQVGAWLHIATLNTAYKPKVMSVQTMAINGDNATYLGIARIDSADGKVYVMPTAAVSNIYLSMFTTYFAD